MLNKGVGHVVNLIPSCLQELPSDLDETCDEESLAQTPCIANVYSTYAWIPM